MDSGAYPAPHVEIASRLWPPPVPPAHYTGSRSSKKEIARIR